MNYIKKLENENIEKTAYISGLTEGINDLRLYLSLPKFSDDIMVNKNDILMRLNDALNLAQQRVDEIRYSSALYLQGVYYCSVCGIIEVDAAGGFDTCEGCSKKI